MKPLELGHFQANTLAVDYNHVVKRQLSPLCYLVKDQNVVVNQCWSSCSLEQSVK